MSTSTHCKPLSLSGNVGNDFFLANYYGAGGGDGAGAGAGAGSGAGGGTINAIQITYEPGTFQKQAIRFTKTRKRNVPLTDRVTL